MTLGAYRGMLRGAVDRRSGPGVAVALCLAAAMALTACNARRNQTVPVASAADLPATTADAPADASSSAPPASTLPPSTMPPSTLRAGQAPTATATLPGDAAAADTALAGESFQAAAPADPHEVMGLGRSAVEALLGQPGLVRREAPAEVWQYQSQGCVLDVFLYQASADFEVVYLEARTGRAMTAATARCLGSVMDRHRRMPSS